MSEMALTASHLIVVGQGRLIADSSVEELTRNTARESVLVRTEQAPRLRDLLAADGVTIAAKDLTELRVSGLTSTAIGRIAAEAGIALSELTPQSASLEEAFMEITRDSLEFDTPMETTR
jgi:ABC-2 type transport system ATP-binding protein